MRWKEVMGYFGCLDERLFWQWAEAVSQHPDIVHGLGAELSVSGRRRLHELLLQGGLSGWQRGGPNFDLAASRGQILTSCRVVGHRTVAGRVELFTVHVTTEPSGEWHLSKKYVEHGYPPQQSTPDTHHLPAHPPPTTHRLPQIRRLYGS